MFWLVVILLIALAITGGIVLSKFIFLLLVLAAVIALVGGRGRTA
jgi:hypothetical protein